MQLLLECYNNKTSYEKLSNQPVKIIVEVILL